MKRSLDHLKKVTLNHLVVIDSRFFRMCGRMMETKNCLEKMVVSIFFSFLPFIPGNSYKGGFSAKLGANGKCLKGAENGDMTTSGNRGKRSQGFRIAHF